MAYWLHVRRALARQCVDRIGLGGYLHLTLGYPAFNDAIDVRNKLRTLLNREIFVRAVLVFPLAKVFPKLDTSVELQQDDYLIEHRLKYIDKRNALSEKDVREIVNALAALFRESI